MTREIEGIMTIINGRVKGKEDVVKKLLVCLLAGGHVLIEDVPGVGKTTLAKSLAESIDGTFGRIQFTPDTLASDVTGISIYNMTSGTFKVMEGPVINNIVLADEINRTSPKTQASLLEVMQEGQVTIDGSSIAVPKPFMVIATQNPIESAGTYKLPEAELDRFLMKLSVGYPSKEDEIEMIKTMLAGKSLEQSSNWEESPVSSQGINDLIKKVDGIYVDKDMADYIVRIAEKSRTSTDIALGISPRGVIGLVKAAQALSFIEGREYIVPDDVKKLAHDVLAHRIILSKEATGKGLTEKAVISDLIRETAIPSIR